jgi:hypothetical protein
VLLTATCIWFCCNYVTTEAARIIIETQVDFDAQDGHRALVALANFYAPMNDGRVDDLTYKIMNVHIGGREDPQPLMLKVQAYREEFFVASGCERDETRLTADLNNSLGDEHGVALSIYHQNPLMDLTVLQNCVQQSWLRSGRNQKRIATAQLSLPVAAPAFAKPPSPNGRHVSFQERGGDRGGRGGVGTVINEIAVEIAVVVTATMGTGDRRTRGTLSDVCVPIMQAGRTLDVTMPAVTAGFVLGCTEHGSRAAGTPPAVP